jgi:hypothetical protein
VLVLVIVLDFPFLVFLNRAILLVLVVVIGRLRPNRGFPCLPAL